MFYHRFETVFDINIYLYSGWSFTTEGWCCVRERERERERERDFDTIHNNVK